MRSCELPIATGSMAFVVLRSHTKLLYKIFVMEFPFVEFLAKYLLLFLLLNVFKITTVPWGINFSFFSSGKKCFTVVLVMSILIFIFSSITQEYAKYYHRTGLYDNKYQSLLRYNMETNVDGKGGPEKAQKKKPQIELCLYYVLFNLLPQTY